jgi:hypothetical protein
MEERNSRTRETAQRAGKIQSVAIDLPSRQSSHPAIEIPPNPMKTINESFFNRHTFRKGDDSGTSEAKTAGEAKAKGGEKAPARRSREAKAANRYTCKLESP